MNCDAHNKLMPHFECEESERFLDRFEANMSATADAPTQTIRVAELVPGDQVLVYGETPGGELR